MLPAVHLRRSHGPQVRPASHQGLQRLLFVVRQMVRPQLGMALGAVACQALRVQAIRLGPPAERAQKEAGRSRVGAMHGHPLFEKCGQ
jgi:hypothetical protein